MNKKRHRQAIDDNLSKALEPPKKRTPPPALNEILSQYTPMPSSAVENKPAELQPTPSTAGTAPTPSTSAAPTRDFTKVANSIVRQAVPLGLFIGKSKLIYDFLYSKTRGAIVPSRSVRITKENLMRGAGVGSERTLYKNLKHLSSVGLVRVNSLGGEHAGSEYTVFLPEETAVPTPPTPPTDASHKVQSPPTAQSGVSGVGLIVDSQDTSAERKTSSFKTNTIDDEAEALSDFNSILCETARELTGRAPKAADREQWAELAKVIVGELNEAAARAGAVSSVPAFLTAHLKRRFAPKLSSRTREGKSPAAAVEISAPVTTPDTERRLTPAEIAEQSRIIAELLESGYTLEQAEGQFAASAHPDDWAAILEAATTQSEREGK